MDNKILLRGGTVIDGGSLKTYRADVLISDGFIREIGLNLPACGGEVIDCSNKYITAGFIDAHVHIESSMVTPREFAKAVVVNGTTTVIADPHEIVNVGGAGGMDAFLDMCEGCVADVFAVVPSSVPATPYDTNGAGEFTADDMKKYLDDKRVVGLGEVMCYSQVIQKDKRISDKIEMFRDKCVDGHTAGLGGEYLDAYAEAGICNDHECTTYEEAAERLKRGLNVYIREGSAARNLDAIISGYVNAKRTGGYVPPISSFAFCTDDKHLATIADEGHIDYNFRRAVSLGLDVAEAAATASFNAAKYYKLADRGNVEKGLRADLVVLDGKLYPFIVIKDGKVVAKNKKPKFTVTDSRNKTRFMQNSVIYREFAADEFEGVIECGREGISFVGGQILTKRITVDESNKDKACILVTAERHGKCGNVSACPVLGYGIKGGAVASSVSHDSHNAVACGDNSADVALALNALKSLGGGYVLIKAGKVIAEVPLDTAGLMSSEDGKTVSAKIEYAERAAHEMGVSPDIDAFITLSFAALPVIPDVRLLDTGLFDVLGERFISRGVK